MNPVFRAFLAGSVSGTCSTLLLQPLDLAKTRIQAGSLKGSTQFSSVGMISIWRDVLHKERVVGLWKGLSPSLLRCIPGVGLYFCSLHTLQVKLGSVNPSNVELMALGAGARCLAGFTMLPVTVVKVRYESGKFRYHSVLNALQTIYSLEGMRGLYSGTLVTLLRDAPFSGLYLLFYTNAKRLLNTDQLGEFSLLGAHFCSGVTAGIMASVVTQPADVIKTRLQTGASPSVSSTIKFIVQTQGFRGFMAGIVPRVVRRTMTVALTWTLYERIMEKLSLK